MQSSDQEKPMRSNDQTARMQSPPRPRRLYSHAIKSIIILLTVEAICLLPWISRSQVHTPTTAVSSAPTAHITSMWQAEESKTMPVGQTLHQLHNQGEALLRLPQEQVNASVPEGWEELLERLHREGLEVVGKQGEQVMENHPREHGLGRLEFKSGDTIVISSHMWPQQLAEGVDLEKEKKKMEKEAEKTVTAILEQAGIGVTKPATVSTVGTMCW